MRVREGAHVSVGQHNRTDHLVLPEHRNDQHAMRVLTAQHRAPRLRDRQITLGFHIGHADNNPRTDGVHGGTTGADGTRECLLPLPKLLRREVMVSGKIHVFAVGLVD